MRAGKPAFDSREGQVFFVRRHVQTGSGPHPAAYPMGTLITHLHLAPRLRMRGAISPLLHTSSSCDKDTITIICCGSNSNAEESNDCRAAEFIIARYE
jgi:hypothetical protein